MTYQPTMETESVPSRVDAAVVLTVKDWERLPRTEQRQLKAILAYCNVQRKENGEKMLNQIDFVVMTDADPEEVFFERMFENDGTEFIPSKTKENDMNLPTRVENRKMREFLESEGYDVDQILYGARTSKNGKPQNDPANYTNKELAALIEGIEDVNELKLMLDNEKTGDNRKGAKNALEERIGELESE